MTAPSNGGSSKRSFADEVLRQTREHPGRSLAIAVGVGYVLGGGLRSRLTARLLGAGIRSALGTAVLPLVVESLAALGGKHTPRTEDVNNENE